MANSKTPVICVGCGWEGIYIEVKRLQYHCPKCGSHRTFEKEEYDYWHARGRLSAPIKWENLEEEENMFERTAEEKQLYESLMEEGEEEVTIGFLLPEGTYHDSKNKIKRIIKKTGATAWNGAGWEGVDESGDKVRIEAVFLKSVLALGKEPEYQGDQLWYTGTRTNAHPLIKELWELGAELKYRGSDDK